MKKLSDEMISETEKLAERYETITLKEIKSKWEEYSEKGILYNVKAALTGFGNSQFCSLCATTRKQAILGVVDCNYCVHSVSKIKHCHFKHRRFIFRSIISKTYRAILNAQTPEELFSAYRDRGIYLRKLLLAYKNNIKNVVKG
jgi:hypothetical protein